MLNVSRMPRLDRFTVIDARRTRPLNPCNSQANQLGLLVDLVKVGSNHVGLSNTKIYSKESLPDLKRGNLRFRGSRRKIVFFQAKGNIVITLNI